MDNMVVGTVVVSEGVGEFEFVVENGALDKVKNGEFVITKNTNGDILLSKIVKIVSVNSLIGNKLEDAKELSRIRTIMYSEKILSNSSKFLASAKVLGVVNSESAEIESNVYPIPVLQEVSLAGDELLAKIFSNGGIKVGCLKVRPSIKVGLNAKELCSRHFAVLAMTGAGKSNTVAVIVQELSEKAKGRMNIVIVDPHGEYVKMRNTHILPAKLNPMLIPEEHLAKLIGVNENSQVQKAFLIYAANTVKYECKMCKRRLSGIEYLRKIEEKLLEWVDTIVKSDSKRPTIECYDGVKFREVHVKRGDEMSINRVIEKLRFFIHRNRNILGSSGEMFDIRADKINVLPLSKIEEEEAITIVGEFLKKALKERIKAVHGEEVEIKAFEKPTLIIIEEAHIFAAKNLKDRSAYWIGRIAKEGRKFGVGLGLVSQRPKELNSTVLSQMNTKIILRIVEPTDQRYILESSENVGEDLLYDLPRLSTGEAIIVGSSLPLPALTKIKRYDGILGGEDGFKNLKDL